MIKKENKKHYRSSTINRYEDFDIYTEDKKIIQENLADLSTKETPVQQTPVYETYHYEMSQIQDSIQNRLKLELNCKEEKNKCLRDQVLQVFFKVSVPQITLEKKKNGKSNTSIGKLAKKTKKITSERYKGKVSDLKVKTKSATSLKKKNPHCKSVNLPKVSVKSRRSGFSNIELKPSFLV
ncbi:hypothetical protein SteCoe_34400 [Stentor coeruleus]|uniref:Uncharacterized protein n=1 Tax=Stentor coeruleus TaxID=5963 RepID=A0A1R2AUN7_9CILI|nr:hypothetical protein SteCoe_34400 [Stentor coeruleus]